MEKQFNRKTGKQGEGAAAEYLQGKGYKVVCRNYCTRYGEIDLICRDNDILVFVEVKAKTGSAFGRPEEMFTRYKLQQVKRTATAYLAGKEVPCRIDMVAVDLGEDGQVSEIRHYVNAG